MIVDVHAHYLPQLMLETLIAKSHKFPNIDCLVEDDIWRLAFSGNTLSRPITPKLRQHDTRLKWLNSEKIDVMVCAGWLDSFGYELPPQEGEYWSCFINEHLARACETTHRYAPLCSVPLQNGKLASKVLGEAIASGFHGAMIGTQPKGTQGNLDDPSLVPFWEMASEKKATIYIHPMFGCGDPRMNDFGLTNTIGRGIDTTTAMARLIFSGHVQKYKGINFVLSHGGGSLPFLQGRLNMNHLHNPEFGDPKVALERCFYDTVVFDVKTLEFLFQLYGSKQLMMGSDYPFAFGDLHPRTIVEKAKISSTDKNNILGEVAVEVFKLDNLNCNCALL